MISLLKKRTKKITITSAGKSAWFSGKGAQNKMYENADRIGHTFYIAEQIILGERLTYRYRSFTNIQTFIAYDSRFENKSFFELLRDGQPVKEYYDFDAKIEDWNDKGDPIIKILCEFLRLREGFVKSKPCPIKIGSRRFDELVITEACNGTKLSLHVIVKNDYYFENSSDLKYYMRKFDEYIKQTDSKFQLDMSVYNRNSLMRIVDSSKATDMSRILKPYSFCKKKKDKQEFYCGYHDGNNQVSFDIKRPESTSPKSRDSFPQLTDEESLKTCALIVKTLKKERASEYDTWLTIGRGLHNVLNGSIQGLDLFLEFSSKCEEKYCERECKDIWDGFGRSGDCDVKVTMGSLMYYYQLDKSPEYKRLYKKRKT